MITVLWDIDGTLIRSGGAGLRALLIAMTECFGVREPKPVPVHGGTDRGIVRALFEVNGVSLTDANWWKLRDCYLQHLKRELGKSEGRVLPDVVPCLELLSAREDVYVGLLTGNVRDGAMLKLSHFQLDHYFRGGGFGDDHEDRNDVARRAWSSVSAELGPAASSQRLWVIGDTPNDVRCARAIDAKVLAVCTGGAERESLAAAEPDLLVEDLTECRDWLERLA